MKLLFLDIETSPNTALVWGFYQQNVGMNMVLATGKTLCWSAKFLGEEKTHQASLYTHSRFEMLSILQSLLDEADAVVHYNGTKFDIPIINKEFLEFKLNPPSPYRQIDLLKTVRSQFRFQINKLDFVCRQLGLGTKVDNRGIQLWIDCMNNTSPEAWKEMLTYNAQDVILTESLYYRLRPWIRQHPNVAVVAQKEHSCPHCASLALQRRGFYFTNSGKYQRYRCNECGTWSRTRATEGVKGILANV